jgi:hypothetical protein
MDHLDVVTSAAAKEDVPSQPLSKDPRELAGFQAFLDQARWLAEWQWRRGEAFERKAGALLAFVGIILTLQTAVARSLITVPKTLFAWTTAALLIISAVALFVAAVACLFVLKLRKYEMPSIEQLRKQWMQYAAQGHLSPEGVTGLLADQLLCGSGSLAPLEGLRKDADDRGDRMLVAVRALFASIASLALLVVVVAFHEVMG